MLVWFKFVCLVYIDRCEYDRREANAAIKREV